MLDHQNYSEDMNPLASYDRVRAAQLFTEYSEQVLRRLRGQFQKADIADLSDAVTSAIMQITAKGIKEDNTKGTMLSLISRVAKRRYVDRIRSHARRKARERTKSESDVTKQQTASNDPEKLMEDRELASLFFSELAHDADEAQYLRLWMGGRTDAEIGDLFHTSQDNREELATLVKQLSQRMRQRISRLRQRVAEEDQP